MKTIYNENPNKCLHCKIIIPYDKRKNKYCSRSCATIVNNIGVNRYKNYIKLPKTIIKKIKPAKFIKKSYCMHCGLLLKNRYGKFCPTKCHKLYLKNIIYKKIEAGDISLDFRQYRDYLIYKFGNKCMKCNWGETNPTTGKIPIEMDHIDGNSRNHRLDNLRLLCPNCHSLTSTYKSLNIGNGRIYRLKKLHKDKEKLI